MAALALPQHGDRALPGVAPVTTMEIVAGLGVASKFGHGIVLASEDLLPHSPLLAAGRPLHGHSAYYWQSFLYHQDRNPGSPEAAEHFMCISEAYLVLGRTILSRKYDLGLLSDQDLRGPGVKPSDMTGANPTPPRSPPYNPRVHVGTQASPGEGGTMFDFDAYYQEHYGEQLDREWSLHARREALHKKQEDHATKGPHWHWDNTRDATFFVVLFLIFVFVGFRI